MDVDQLIIDVMVVFMLLAAADKCFGGKLGLGAQLDEALSAIGPMCIPMAGMILLAPMIGSCLSPVVSPLYSALGADPAMFATSVLACDMGGHPLAVAMAADPESGRFAGCILGASLGGVISFLMPVGTAMIDREHQQHFAMGVLIGVITIPIGLLAGGLAAGYPIVMIAANTTPILIMSAIIAVALLWARETTIMLFRRFGSVLSALAVSGFALGIVQELTPIRIVDDLTSVLDGIKVVGSVAIVLCGAYPMLYCLNKLLGRSITRIAWALRIDKCAVLGLLGGFANIMPILGTGNRMTPNGLMVAMAFAVSGSCMFGDHLGYMASVDRGMIVPMLAAKAAGAFSAAAIAAAAVRRMRRNVS